MPLPIKSSEVYVDGQPSEQGILRMATSDVNANYLSVHLARFDDVRHLSAHRDEPPAGSPSSWLIGADEGRHGSEFASQLASEFIAVGVHADETSARACASAEVDVFVDTTEVWSAALQPTKSHGYCNWIGNGGHFAVDRSLQPTDGAVITLTTAGWELGPDFDVERPIGFSAAVDRVRTWMTDEPIDGMLSSQIFNFPGLLVHDGPTFSIWRDDNAMKNFAYRPGVHKTEMDAFRLDENADRTSWTRLRAIESHGTWWGVDPLTTSPPRGTLELSLVTRSR